MNILYDTDFIIALHIPTDTHHKRAKKFITSHSFSQENILNITMYECITTVSYKFSQQAAKGILDSVYSSNITIMDFKSTSLESNVYDLFKSQSKKGTSFFDCAVLVTAKEYDMQIASFDRFYPPKFLVQ